MIASETLVFTSLDLELSLFSLLLFDSMNRTPVIFPKKSLFVSIGEKLEKMLYLCQVYVFPVFPIGQSLQRRSD